MTRQEAIKTIDLMLGDLVNLYRQQGLSAAAQAVTPLAQHALGVLSQPDPVPVPEPLGKGMEHAGVGHAGVGHAGVGHAGVGHA